MAYMSLGTRRRLVFVFALCGISGGFRMDASLNLNAEDNAVQTNRGAHDDLAVPSFASKSHARGALLDLAGSQAAVRTGLDPIFLATAVGLSTVANIGNVVLTNKRISGMKDVRSELIGIQDAIADEHADACFSMRSLEVQADLLSRAIEAFVRYTMARLPEEAVPLVVLDGKLESALESNATATRLLLQSGTQVSTALSAVTNRLRRTMDMAVQAACHSATSGEMVIQHNVEKLAQQIQEAEQDLQDASFQFLSDLSISLFANINFVESQDLPHAKLRKLKKDGRFALNMIMGVATGPLARAITKPKGLSDGTWQAIQHGLGVTWTAAFFVAATTQQASAVDIVVTMNTLLDQIITLCNDEGSSVATPLALLGIVNSVLRIASNALYLVKGKTDPALLYAHLTIDTITAMIRLAKTALQLQQERAEQRDMRSQAKAAAIEVKLARAHGTCNALGIAWGLAGTAERFVEALGEQLESIAGGTHALEASVGEDLLSDTYNQYAEERPALAAKILTEAFRQSTPGVTQDMVKKASSLALRAPITDFVVARGQAHAKALGALGFAPVSAVGHINGTRFLVCRGCGDTVITGMAVVKDARAFRETQVQFTSDPPRFGGAVVPEGATLNFVQFPREEGFFQLAFIKVPRETAAASAMSVLYDLSEDIFVTESYKFGQKEREQFRDLSRKRLEAAGVEVLGWKQADESLSWQRRTGNFIALDSMGDEHRWLKEFGSLDVLTGRFAVPPFGQGVNAKSMRGLVLAHTLAPFGYVTATRGCACAQGPLGNRYRSGPDAGVGAEVNALLWRTLVTRENQLQEARCKWRVDYWLSSVPIDEDSITANLGENLFCSVSIKSISLAGPVEDPSRLVLVPFYVGPAGERARAREEVLGNLDEEQKTGMANKVADSQDGDKGKGPPMMELSEEGDPFGPMGFEVWQLPEPALPSQVHRASRGLALATVASSRPRVREFRKTLESTLCGGRCVFASVESVSSAVGKILQQDSRPVDGFKIVSHQRGSSKCKDDNFAKGLLLQGNEPPNTTSDFETLFGPLSMGDAPLNSRLEAHLTRLYQNHCDFQAVFVLNPTPDACGPDSQPPELWTDSVDGGRVTESCSPSARGGSPPLHRYAVVMNFNYHRDTLLEEEAAAEEKLSHAGYVVWGRPSLWTRDKFHTDFNKLYWGQRSLRQRVFVLRDPRIGEDVATERDVCST